METCPTDCVELPAGQHQVELEYRPRMLHLGPAISLGTLLLVLLGLIWAVIRILRRDNGPVTPPSRAETWYITSLRG